VTETLGGRRTAGNAPRDGVLPVDRQEASAARYGALVVLGVLSAALVWSRFSLLGQSFFRDEAFTAVHYVDRGPHAILFGRSVPNNHVLFSLLTWITTQHGGQSEAVYRIWSVVPATAAAGVIAWWAWRRISPFAAVMTVLLTLVAPIHLLLAPEARGYGLAFLAGAGMLVGAIRAGEEGRTRDIVTFAAFGAVGILTLPVFVLAFLAQAAVLVALPALRRRTLVAVVAAGALCLVVYAPLLDDIRRNSNQQFGVRLRWYGWVTRPYGDLVSPTLRSLAPNRPEWLGRSQVVFAVAVLLGVLAIVRCVRRNEYVLLASLVVPILGTYVALVIARVYVEPRFASFLLFHALVLLALGLTELWTFLHRFRILHAVAVLFVAALVVVGLRNAVVDTNASAKKPLENFQLIHQIVTGAGFAQVYTNSKTLQEFDFYFGRGHYSALRRGDRVGALFCDEKEAFAYVEHNWDDNPDFSVDCLRSRGAVRIHVDQLVGSTDVWLVKARSRVAS
jgi:hypothetical protein